MTVSKSVSVRVPQETETIGDVCVCVCVCVYVCINIFFGLASPKSVGQTRRDKVEIQLICQVR